MSKERVRDVLGALRAAFESNGWHGPTVLEAVRGLGQREAARLPSGCRNSIHQLVDHIEYWEAMTVHYIRRGTSPRRRRKDWASPNLSFRDSVRRLKGTHRILVAAIAVLDDGELARRVRTVSAGRVPLWQVLHGVSAHDAYHAGQIRLLRCALR